MKPLLCSKNVRTNQSMKSPRPTTHILPKPFSCQNRLRERTASPVAGNFRAPAARLETLTGITTPPETKNRTGLENPLDRKSAGATLQ